MISAARWRSAQLRLQRQLPRGCLPWESGYVSTDAFPNPCSCGSDAAPAACPAVAVCRASRDVFPEPQLSELQQFLGNLRQYLRKEKTFLCKLLPKEWLENVS